MFELNSIKLNGNSIVLPADFRWETWSLNQLHLCSPANLLGRNHPGTSVLVVHFPAQRAGIAEPQSWQEQNLWHSTVCALNRTGN